MGKRWRSDCFSRPVLEGKPTEIGLVFPSDTPYTEPHRTRNRVEVERMQVKVKEAPGDG
ncbi:hypothetical protein ZHAS_00015682 [Anopheles sinensis]|nr:hypothetical protein ZHAS_00015682 [Anopheles sinensis]